MSQLAYAALTIAVLTSSSNGSHDDTERYRVPRQAREMLVEWKATVEHGDTAAGYTAELTADQAAALRAAGFELIAQPRATRSAGGYTSYADMRATFLACAAAHPSIAKVEVLDVSASGCRALVSASGTASASAASGFDLAASSVEGGKDGLFFYGANGRQANSWGNGTSYQCVVPPVRRTGLLKGTGASGSCGGVFTEDLNARWTAKPAHNPGAGAVVQAQLWHRDPMSTSNLTTSLSNAVEFTVGP